MTLFLSIVALLLGPLIYVVGRRNKIARQILDGLILITIAVIILFDIIPDAIAQGGGWAIAVLLLGVGFPMLLENVFRRAADAAHLVIVAVAAAGLILHAVVDGLVLIPDNGTGLAHAIILHRPAVGMAIWWTMRPAFGTPAAVATLALIILATASGYFLGESTLPFAETRSLALLQAFVSGSLLHVIIFGAKHHSR
jgi:hypothetical protein